MLSISPYKHLAENSESQSANCFWFHWASLSWPTSASWWCCWLYDRCIGAFRVKRKFQIILIEEWDCWSKDFAILHNLHHCNLNCQSPSDNRCYPLPQFHHLCDGCSNHCNLLCFCATSNLCPQKCHDHQSLADDHREWLVALEMLEDFFCCIFESITIVFFNRDNNFNAVFLVGIFFA